MQSHRPHHSGLWTKLFFSTTFKCQIRFLTVPTVLMKNAAILCGYTGKQSFESTSRVAVSVAMFRVLLSNHGRQWPWMYWNRRCNARSGFHYRLVIRFFYVMPYGWMFHACRDGSSECIMHHDCLLAALPHIRRTPESCSEVKSSIHVNTPSPRLMKTSVVIS